MRNAEKRFLPRYPRLSARWRRLALAVTLSACAGLAGGCAWLVRKPPADVTVIGDGSKHWYGPGELVQVRAGTNGLWVLPPEILRAMIMESTK